MLLELLKDTFEKLGSSRWKKNKTGLEKSQAGGICEAYNATLLLVSN